VELGLSNYWGYNTLGFFCPDPRYASTADPRHEFRSMVRRLHAAGIEVILDVVFNHTPEGDERGPTLSWRGLDNRSWYRLPDDRQDRYHNWSGCGNALNVHHPRVLQMVMDSLRYWVQEMHVDGFRFDLAPMLGRGASGFERDGPFFKAVLQDPVLQGIKLIAEPWDVGPGGYQVGQFPRGWLEWNDHFRDTARAFWLGGDCTRGELALRLAGSSDLFQARRRSPLESVNYVVSHDGFTLTDLVSYDMRHNRANAEDNRDGHPHNLSWNCGWEGPTTDPMVTERRARLKRALLATLLLAQGTPMLAAGDELGHSQGGNNNPYCQDNPITWINWALADRNADRLHRPPDPPAQDPDALGATLVHRPARQPRPPRPGLAAPHRRADDAGALEQPHVAGAGRLDRRARAQPGAAAADVQRPGHRYRLPSAAGQWVAELDTSAADGRSTWRAGKGTSDEAALPSICPSAAWCCCATRSRS
jgi:glycogen operon protein